MEEKKARKDKGLKKLTERDLAVLGWMGQQYAVRFDTLQKLVGQQPGVGARQVNSQQSGERNVRRLISRWQEVGLVKYQKYLHAEPGWVWLTIRGLREIGLDYRGYTPSAATLRHLHLVNEVRLRLEGRYGERLTWKGERRLRRELDELTEAERRGRHLTDADITVDGKLVGVEVELTQKSARKLEQIINRLRVQYPAIWYFVNDYTEPVIQKAIGKHGQKFKVYNLGKVLR